MRSVISHITRVLLLMFFALGGTFVSDTYAKSSGPAAAYDKTPEAITPLTDKQVNKRLKKCLGIKPIENNYIKPISYGDCFDSSIENTYNHFTAIVPIEDEIKFTGFSELPEEYDIWNNSINPYNVSLVDMKDTIMIDVSGYHAPSLKHVTSNFGFRKWRHHYGIDLKVHRGDTVKCAFDGVVRVTRYDRRGYGYFTIVRHNNGLETIYGHMSKFLAQVGDTLRAGDAVGMGGNTGRSTGYHLHFELRYLGNPINPNDIIDFESHSAKNRVLVLTAQNFEYKKEIDKIRYWTVRSGDTLGRISQRTGVSISKLCALNGITRKTILRIGRRIRYT